MALVRILTRREKSPPTHFPRAPGWMGKLRSSPFVCFSSHSTAIISSISLCFVQRASIIFLFLNFTNVSGVKFDPPIQLPGSRTSQYVSNSSTVLYIHDFGARGNGMSDDTKVSLCCYYFSVPPVQFKFVMIVFSCD